MIKTIPEFPDYKINIDGQIFNKHGRELKPSISGGYYQVVLCKNKKRKHLLVHRLLALTFLPNFYGKPQVDHKNRNKLDNRLFNLRWTTSSENQQNTGIRKTNTSGHQNIYYDKSQKRWRFQKTINNKMYRKNFKTIEEAIAYRDLFSSGLTEYHQR